MAFLKSRETQGSLELSKVFRQFGRPGHPPPRLFRMFEAEDFGM
jgi:hypothetical protein